MQFNKFLNIFNSTQCAIASFIQGYKQEIGESREVSNETKWDNEPEIKVEKTSEQIPIDEVLPSNPVAPIQFKCNDAGRFAYPGSCEKYFFCWDKSDDVKKFRIFTCPHNTAFDPATQLCVHDFGVCAVALKCEHDSKRVLPNPDDKSTFFQCKHHHSSKKIMLQKRECAEGREFDAEYEYCKSIFAQDDVSLIDSSDSSEDIVECEKPGIFMDYSNDSNYYECIVKSVSKGSLKLVHHSCPRFHIFTMIEKRCVSLLKVRNSTAKL